jgi:DNA double-strand break repair helicase HerA and related ATPase
VLRSILTLEEAGAGAFFGEPAFDVADLVRRDGDRGVISLLELADVMDRPRLFSTFMLWLLARLYTTLPEIGDTAEPVLAFFFDEAYLLFDDASDALLEQIELTARLIRSKGVGVFFVTHTPTDVPPPVLGQLGNRVQHALRAFTPKDADDLRKTARTFPITEHYDVEEALTSLGIGEALITVLTPDGVPSPLAWTRIVPPDSRMAPADATVLMEPVAGSPLRVKYLAAPDRQSAHEILGERLASADAVAATPPPPRRRERSVFGTLHVPRR